MVSIFKNGRHIADFYSLHLGMSYAVQSCMEGDTVEVEDHFDPYLELRTSFCSIGGKILSWEERDDAWEMVPSYFDAKPEVKDARLHTRSYTGVTTDIKYARSEHRAGFGHSGGYACFKRRARRISRYVGKELIKEQLEAA